MGERKVGREIRVEEREPHRGRRRDRGETKIKGRYEWAKERKRTWTGERKMEREEGVGREK